MVSYINRTHNFEPKIAAKKVQLIHKFLRYSEAGFCCHIEIIGASVVIMAEY